MKLVEIAGHLIDPGKVSYVGPLEYDQDASSPRSTAARSDAYSFKICVGGGVTWMCRAYIRSDAKAQRDALISAIESAERQAEIAALEAIRSRFSWPEYGLNEKGGHLAEDYLTGDCWPKQPDPNKSPGDNGAMGASDALEAADILEGYNTGEFVIGTETPDTKLDITDDRSTLTLVECPATKLHIGDTDASDALVGVEAE